MNNTERWTGFSDTVTALENMLNVHQTFEMISNHKFDKFEMTSEMMFGIFEIFFKGHV